MTTAELTEWMAYERVWGPILPHERIDIGFAKLTYYLVSLLSRSRQRIRVEDFLPGWMSDLVKKRAEDPRQLEATLESWASANDQHVNS